MKSIIDANPHTLHKCHNLSSLKTNLYNYDIDLSKLIRDFFISEDGYAAMVVGSLIDGLATQVSDVDILVLVEDESVLLSDKKFVCGVPIVDVLGGSKGWTKQVLIVKNGIEFNIDFVTIKGFTSLIGILASNKAPKKMFTAYDISHPDIQFLDRLRTGWVFEGDEISTKWRKIFGLEYLCDHLVKQYYIFSVAEFEDVCAASGGAPGLLAHMGRVSVEYGLRSLLARYDFSSRSQKWLRKINILLENIDENNRRIFITGRKLMFPSILSIGSEQKLYISEVAKFLIIVGEAISDHSEKDQVVSLMLSKLKQNVN